jgi:hypothetical protein
MEEYLTVKELSKKIKFSKQSLYNLIHKGTLVLGKHYLKPTPKKVLFKWTEIETWMGETSAPDINPPNVDINQTKKSDQGQLSAKLPSRAKPRSLINI